MFVYLSTFFLIYLVRIKWRGLFEDDTQKIQLMREMSTGRIAFLATFLVGGLLIIQRNEFGAFGRAPYGGVSLALYAVIGYEAFEALCFIFAKDAYIGLTESILKSVPLFFKLLALAELVLFAYLLVRPFLILFGAF